LLRVEGHVASLSQALVLLSLLRPNPPRCLRLSLLLRLSAPTLSRTLPLLPRRCLPPGPSMLTPLQSVLCSVSLLVCLSCGLLLLGLRALLGLPLLALSSLRLAGAALLVACSCGAAFGLRAALGTGLAG